ncbi:MAG: tRNA (guanosine(37)-N1)-methyltransferase TrmD [Candidatus Latescibacteria bacterium]|nr:tRNA (guanosine(37)-N1)-methyltransferase TrmD [Candidatus Latescibacterota bacterium]
MDEKKMGGMSVSVLTIFPDMIKSFIKFGIVKRAIEKKLFSVEIINIRDSATDRHRTVDDTPYGGGSGMIIKPDILAASLKSAKPFREGRIPRVFFLTPQGRRLDQSYANEISLLDEYVLVCGRYRAVDERFRELYVTDELSIGDYVISGGEAAAMVVIDAVTRLLPGVLNDFESGIDDSFQNGMLDCPWYTRPETFEGRRVPDVLVSGNHSEIQKWRSIKSLQRTKEKRPDLLNQK